MAGVVQLEYLPQASVFGGRDFSPDARMRNKKGFSPEGLIPQTNRPT